MKEKLSVVALVLVIAVLGMFITLFAFGSGQRPYTVETETIDGHVYHVFLSSKGSIFVERGE